MIAGGMEQLDPRSSRLRIRQVKYLVGLLGVCVSMHTCTFSGAVAIIRYEYCGPHVLTNWRLSLLQSAGPCVELHPGYGALWRLSRVRVIAKVVVLHSWWTALNSCIYLSIMLSQEVL